MAEIKENEVYTTEEARDLLKVSQSTMKRLIKKGIIKAAKIGGQHRILGAELLRHFLPEPVYDQVRKVYYVGKQRVKTMIEQEAIDNEKDKQKAANNV